MGTANDAPARRICTTDCQNFGRDLSIMDGVISDRPITTNCIRYRERLEAAVEAIRLAHEYRGRIDLLMTDVVMPEMNGRELAGNVLSHYPDLNRLFMSGYTANVIAHHGVLDESVHFIQEPFSMKDLGVSCARP